MILFKEWLIGDILKGKKTQTRRDWKKAQAKVGSIHLVKTQMLSKYYLCKIRITGIRKELLGDITEEDALKEGCESVKDFITIWKQMNGSWDPEKIVFVIDFELAYSDLKPGDKVILSEECAEYMLHGNVEWEITSNPAWWPGNEMISIERNTEHGLEGYTFFATEFLEKVEASS